MDRNFSPGEFGTTLRELRKQAGRMTLTRLASELMKTASVRISATSLHYLETGRYKKPPARETVRGIARALGLSPSKAQEFLELAGQNAASLSLLDRATDSIRSVLQIAGEQDAEAFIQRVESYADRFACALSARDEDVRIALIPIAGWQARLLAPEIIERMLVPALYEVTHARISEAVLIVAPGTTPRSTLREKFAGLALRIVEQAQQSGLARALVLGRPSGYFGPVAVLLPDEVDPTGEALGELVRQYKMTHKPLIGVNPLPVEKEKHEVLRYYGVATLRSRSVARQYPRVHELETRLLEKPQEPRAFPPLSRKIAGRYILTPEVFEAVETTGSELTSALNEHWSRLYAYQFRKDLIALSPYKGIIDVISLVESRLFPLRSPTAAALAPGRRAAQR